MNGSADSTRLTVVSNRLDRYAAVIFAKRHMPTVRIEKSVERI